MDSSNRSAVKAELDRLTGEFFRAVSQRQTWLNELTHRGDLRRRPTVLSAYAKTGTLKGVPFDKPV